MHYHEAVNDLLDLRRFRMQPGIESTRALLSHLGDPQDGLRVVQVTGSNGKGSTARMVDSILREAGLKVGRYTSPHLEDVRERVQVDGRPIPKAAVSAFVEETGEYVTRAGADGSSPTFFETLTALALWHFDRADCDVAVLEAGIGGRYDATSAVAPAASAVTSVAREHTDVLGEDVETIAADKAQVAPADRPLVTGAEGAALAAVREAAGEVVTVGDRADADVRARYGGRRGQEGAVDLSGDGWGVEARVPAPGAVLAQNAGVAATLARQVADVSDEALSRGLRGASLPGRFEVVETDPLVVLDGAHNPAACEGLAETLAEFEYDDLSLVFGAMHDKDHAEMAAALPAADRVYTCEPAPDRAADPAVLARVFERTDAGAVTAGDDVAAHLDDALAAADPSDAVVVAGSLYVVGEARARWTRQVVPTRVESTAEARAALERTAVPAGAVERLADRGVHRVLRTRLQPRRASVVAEELRALGGACAVSGVESDRGDPVGVCLMADVETFDALADALPERGRGLEAVARSIRAALDDDPGVATGGSSAARDADSALPWSDGTAVMGILNVTPDSFHDGGEYDAVPDAVARAERMVAEGADIVDVGGESTRPGADPVPPEMEAERVLPVVRRIADLDAAVSVDTRRAEVADRALEAGADVVNDVSGLEDPAMRFVAADHGAPLVVMHSIEAPVDPDADPTYDDVVEDVRRELRERVLLARRAGLPPEKILVDPGLGFGKTPAQDFELLDRLGEFRAAGCPVMVGHSHKSMFGAVDRYPDEGGYATVAATALAAERGADVVRVHDVAENVAAVRTVEAAAEGAGRSDPG